MEERYIAVDKGSLRFLDGGGEVGQRIRAFNLNPTPIGLPEDWPQALKTLVNQFLASKHSRYRLFENLWPGAPGDATDKVLAENACRKALVVLAPVNA